MTQSQQAGYTTLTNKLAHWTEPEAPVIASSARTNGQFTATTPAIYATAYSLSRAGDPTATSWTSVTNALIATNGNAVTLTDPTDRGPAQFYKVGATKP